jgi:hypothetical protein
MRGKERDGPSVGLVRAKLYTTMLARVMTRSLAVFDLFL